MLGRLPTSCAVSLVLLCALSGACSSTSAGPASPAPTGASKSILAVESGSARPEFLPGRDCPGRPSFGTTIVILVSGDEDLILRELRFTLFDRFHVRTQPDVFSIVDGVVPTALPVPIPAGLAPIPRTAPIPIPGSAPITGLLVNARRPERLPFFLRFGCDITPQGTIEIEGTLHDRGGRPRDEELRVALQ
jgi:hypothetical protein